MQPNRSDRALTTGLLQPKRKIEGAPILTLPKAGIEPHHGLARAEEHLRDPCLVPEDVDDSVRSGRGYTKALAVAEVRRGQTL